MRVITSHANGLPKTETRDGVQIIRVPCRRKELYRAGFSSMLLYILRGAWEAMLLVRSWQPEVIHVHFAVPSGALALIINEFTNIPYILTTHLGDVPGGVPEKTNRWFRWVKPFTPRIWKKAARVTAVSAHTRQLALAHYPVDIQVIPNAVDTHALDPGVIAINDPPGIMFAGRFQPQKNPLQIVQTLSQVANLPWRATLVGDGPLREEVEAEIERLGLQDRIACPGWVEPDQVIEAMRGGDLLFMPSRSEGLPMVGLQALSMGLAIVAGEVGGFVDLVEDGRNGYLLHPDDAAGFEREVRGLLSDRERLLQFRQHSRAMAGRFDIRKVGVEFEQLFMDVTGVV